MNKTIIIAGAGYGGLAAAALLAKAGHRVAVYEQRAENEGISPWSDYFPLSALKIAGIRPPNDSKYRIQESVMMFSPNQETALRQTIPRENVESLVDCNELYALLLQNAVQNGAELFFGQKILAPMLLGSRVAGIRCEQGEHYADLVIDAAGIDSPVRSGLPAMCCVETALREDEQIYLYRAVLTRNADAEISVQANTHVYMMPGGAPGISRLMFLDDRVEVQVGRYSPFEEADALRTLALLRGSCPELGSEFLAEGHFHRVPARHPLSVMLCDGYAALGDSAFMSTPVTGVGLANGLKAARILANTILADKAGAFSAETLWDYQTVYYKKLGAGLASLACIQQLLARLTPEELDGLFEQGILTTEDFIVGAGSTNISTMLRFSPAALRQRMENISHDRNLARRLLPVVLQAGRIAAVTSLLPKRWNKQSVINWAKRYQGSVHSQ